HPVQNQRPTMLKVHLARSPASPLPHGRTTVVANPDDVPTEPYPKDSPVETRPAPTSPDDRPDPHQTPVGNRGVYGRWTRVRQAHSDNGRTNDSDEDGAEQRADRAGVAHP